MRKTMFSEQIAVIGLGKLGAPMAACIAEQGFRVHAVDLDERKVAAIRQGLSPVDEPELDKLFAENKARITATTDHAEAIAASDACFVIVPTPANAEGVLSLQYAKWAFREIGKAIRAREGYYLVAMISTVMPGACRHGLIPVLEESSGKVAGRDFGFCYVPEFVALGRAVRDILTPDFKLLGEIDERAGDLMEDIYVRIFRNGAPCCRMSLENAELAKLSLNTYVSMKISFANSLAELCDKIPGGDVDVITEALGLDRRIGHRYLRGGAPYGGHCFPIETRALAQCSEQLGLKPRLPGAAARVNEQLVDHLVGRIGQLAVKEANIALLGLAYKPGTPEVELSASIELANRLTDKGYRVVAFDPMASEKARHCLTGGTVIRDTLAACLDDADVVVVTTADPMFIALEEDQFGICAEKVIVFDLWRVLAPKLERSRRVRYEAFGRAGCAAEETPALFEELWGSS